MSGSGRYVLAQYVNARLCPNGCGDTLEPSSYDGEPITRCAECEWLGLSFEAAAKIIAPAPKGMLEAQPSDAEVEATAKARAFTRRADENESFNEGYSQGYRAGHKAACERDLDAMVEAGTYAALAVDVGPGAPDPCCSIKDYPHPIAATRYLDANQMRKVVRAALTVAKAVREGE